MGHFSKLGSLVGLQGPFDKGAYYSYKETLI